jgi:hypothetical protein
MDEKSGTSEDAADKLFKGICRKTRKQNSAEEKIRIVLAGSFKNTHRCRALPNQVAHRFMRRIRHPHGCQLARTVQLGQHHGGPSSRDHPPSPE